MSHLQIIAFRTSQNLKKNINIHIHVQLMHILIHESTLQI